MRVATPLGEYPLELRRVERRPGAVAIVGNVAGLESSIVFDAADLRAAAKVLALPLALATLLYLRRRR